MSWGAIAIICDAATFGIFAVVAWRAFRDSLIDRASRIRDWEQ